MKDAICRNGRYNSPKWKRQLTKMEKITYQNGKDNLP